MNAGGRLLCALVSLLVASLPAAAHDSWFSVLPSAQGSRFGFSTGTRYPVPDLAPPPESVAQAGCVDGHGRRHALRAGEAEGKALVLAGNARGPVGCWLELHTFEVTLEPRLVDVYFRDIQPPAAVRSAWAEQFEAGLPWLERYRKFARVEHGTAQASPAMLRRLRAPIGLPLEIVIDGDAPLRTGDAAAFRVLANGKPVPDLSVELVSERSRFGVWARSDAQGRIAHRLPFGGNWLLRAVLLEPDEQPGQWKSRFVTLAFEVE